MLVKTNNPGFMKDTETGAIINTDDDAHKKFLAQREEIKKSKDICNRMNTLENELQDIKSLLLQIVHRNN